MTDASDLAQFAFQSDLVTFLSAVPIPILFIHLEQIQSFKLHQSPDHPNASASCIVAGSYTIYISIRPLRL
ncbi:hypothetical protein Hypma_010908 [Hypsizygus marmoreus]|uniref:Uncharacterized protein n=1 Tax=Hypsizygus marmoreus TaxID=39966 RepID=A0A369JIR5_HYPMA|nr:hypothetical protein Hypma_010908 [Hypsizygus marmoreus]